MAKTDEERTPNIRVSVHLPGGQLAEDRAEVALVRKDQRTVLDPLTPGLYGGRVEVGSYQLEAEVGDLVSPPRSVEVGSDPITASAYVGHPDWPFYRYGQNSVPFEPRDDLVGVAFPERMPEPDEAEGIMGRLLERVPLETFAVEEGEGERANVTAVSSAAASFRNSGSTP